jgi:hypothetical protein
MNYLVLITKTTIHGTLPFAFSEVYLLFKTF